MINESKNNIIIPFLGLTNGGGVRVLCELANGLSNIGFNVVLLTTPISSFPFSINENVIIISRSKSKRENKITTSIKDFLFIYKKSASYGDIFISNYYTTFYIGFFLNLFTKKLHIYFIQGYEPDFFDIKKSYINIIKSLIARISYNIKPNLRITISQFIKNKIGKKDIVIINDGVELKTFNPNYVKNENDFKKTICSIALSIKRKGFQDFVKAIQILESKRSDFRILLFSSERHTKFDLSFPHTIIYPNDDKEIVKCLQESDIFISSSHLEGFGLPGLEAMACGSVLITTNSGGVSEYAINEFNSLIVNIGDVDALVIAIEKLLDQPSLMQKLRSNGIETSKLFSWEIMCEKFKLEIIKLQKEVCRK